MASKKNWLSSLQNLEGAVVDSYDPHKHVVRFPSPSMNFMFGNGHGIGAGCALALGGPPKGGKTLLTHSAAGQLHADDPEAVVIRFDSEFRTKTQGTPESRQRIWGIDPDRYLSYEVNRPDLIFDRIETEIAAKCQDGMPLRLLIIDSIGGIQGRRSMNADSIMVQQIGDNALTLGEGFRRIMPLQHKFNFSVIITCQIRAELDALEQKRGNKYKMAMPLSVMHYADHFMYVEPNRNKEGRTDLLGNEFKNDDLTDVVGNSEQTGHKIRAKMRDSSVGPKGRSAEFTLDPKRGIINIHEEVFLLGIGRGVIDRPNNVHYLFGGEKYIGRPAMLEAIKNNPQLSNAIVDEVFRRDRDGAFDGQDASPEEDDE